MSRLSREKREQQGAGAGQPVLAAAPIDVLVGPGGASVGGVPVPVIPGEELHHTVLNHLHRIALATGHPVHATIHDDRIGYVVALRIDTNGSSHLVAEPVPTAPPGVPEGSVPGATGPASPEEAASGLPGPASRDGGGPEEPGQVSRDVFTSGVPDRFTSGVPDRALRDGDPAGEPGRAPSPTAPTGPASFPPRPAEPTDPSKPPATAPGASAFPSASRAFPDAPESAEPIQDSVPLVFPAAPESVDPIRDSVPPQFPDASDSAAPSASVAPTSAGPYRSAEPGVSTPPSGSSVFPAAPESADPIRDSVPPQFPDAPESPEPIQDSAPPVDAVPSDQPPRDKPTHLLRQTPEPSTFPLRAVPDPGGQEPRDAVPTFRLRAVPEWVADAVPGTVAAPTGQFGPPPVMDAPVTDAPTADAPATDADPDSGPRPTPEPHSAPESHSAPGPAPASGPAPTFGSAPVADSGRTAGPAPTYGSAPAAGSARTAGPAPTSGPAPAAGLTAPTSSPAPASSPVPTPSPALTPISIPSSAPTPKPSPLLDPSTASLDTPDPKPTPPRGFDAVAEAVLGDDPATAYDGGGAMGLAEPMGRINEAVKEGRTDAAAQIAERTVVEASRTLGPEHPEVLRLLELTAYIAYLAGDPARAFGLSLDLARSRRHARDAEAAYGNIQSAATAWRAVRDPEQGLRMGVELIGLWTELTREGGPAVEDIEQLESARTRMGRLAERARKLNP
jgi:hypothetical protein